MLLAKEEHAEKTYAELKDEYLTIKAMLNVAGVNLTGLDKIKEEKSINRKSKEEPALPPWILRIMDVPIPDLY